jgi:hypothetical protein
MSNKKIFRFAGWSAIISAILMLAAMVSFPIGAGMLGGFFEIIALLLVIFVFYALYNVYRTQSARLSLAGIVLLVLAVVVDIISMSFYTNTILGGLWYLSFSLPFLIFGSLAFRDRRMQRGLAIVTLVIGGLLLIGGVAGVLGSAAIADTVTAIPFLMLIIWLAWLWRFFWSSKLIGDTPDKLEPLKVVPPSTTNI